MWPRSLLNGKAILQAYCRNSNRRKQPVNFELRPNIITNSSAMRRSTSTSICPSINATMCVCVCSNKETLRQIHPLNVSTPPRHGGGGSYCPSPVTWSICEWRLEKESWAGGRTTTERPACSSHNSTRFEITAKKSTYQKLLLKKKEKTFRWEQGTGFQHWVSLIL